MTTAQKNPRTSRAIIISMFDKRFREAPVLTVYGGKITTYRRLAEAVMERLRHFFHHAPGLDPGRRRCQAAISPGTRSMARSQRHGRPGRFWKRITRSGWCRPMAHALTACSVTAKSAEELGTRFGADLTEAEVRYLMQHEWAESADDVLWRRSKLGLLFSEEQKEALGRFMAGRPRSATGQSLQF